MATETLQFNPSLAGEACAQALHEGVPDPSREFSAYADRVSNHYYEIGMFARDPGRALLQTLRHQMRVSTAPLFMRVEELLSERTAQYASDTAIEQLAHESQQEPHIDYNLRNGRKADYTGAQWDFLRSAGTLAYRAGLDFIRSAHADSYTGQLFDLFRRVDARFMSTRNYNMHFKDYRVRFHTLSRFLEKTTTSNITTLITLEIARRHNVHARLGELSWAASAGREFFERYFSDDTVADETAPSPFVSCPHLSPDASIWSIQSLKDGPWDTGRFCPANIPLRAAQAPRRTATAAELRLKTMLPLARHILWQETA